MKVFFTNEGLEKLKFVIRILAKLAGLLAVFCAIWLLGSIGTVDYSTYVPITKEEMDRALGNIALSIVIGCIFGFLYYFGNRINAAINNELQRRYAKRNKEKQLLMMKRKQEQEDFKECLRISRSNKTNEDKS